MALTDEQKVVLRETIYRTIARNLKASKEAGGRDEEATILALKLSDADKAEQVRALVSASKQAHTARLTGLDEEFARLAARKPKLAQQLTDEQAFFDELLLENAPEGL